LYRKGTIDYKVMYCTVPHIHVEFIRLLRTATLQYSSCSSLFTTHISYARQIFFSKIRKPLIVDVWPGRVISGTMHVLQSGVYRMGTREHSR